MEKVLLHVCCAPCSLGCFDFLKDKEVILFFSNSNIFPEEEWIKRFEELKKVGKIKAFKVLIEDYNHKDWRECVLGLEAEPEKGKRCLKCFEFNLRKSAKKAKELKCDFFATTLTIGPHKNSNDILKIGRSIEKEEGVKFLDLDFKEGFKKSVKLSRELNIYRQKYCGCEFSKAGS